MRRINGIYLLLMVVAGLAIISGCGRHETTPDTSMPIAEMAATDPATETPPADAAVAPTKPVDVAPATSTNTKPPTAPKKVPPAAAPPVATPSAAAPASPSVPMSPAVSEPKPPAPAAATPKPASGTTVVVGRISVVSHVPDPSEVPYTDCLTMVKYTVEDVASG